MKKILIICSKRFYSEIPKIKEELDKRFEVHLPNCYDAPQTEQKMWSLGKKEHAEFKSKMIKHSEQVISTMDAVLVLNFDKDNQKNYIGGATFLEIYDAFRYDKKIYLYNDIPEGMLYDELEGFNPIIINGKLEEIK
jgi:Asp-tRNA(Asn)/Glu-tRNA(Gln) amidotransferase B subunit